MSSLTLNGKFALVTGAGSGIGRATCQILEREGAKVIAADINVSKAQETIDMLKEPGQHMALEMDVTSLDSVMNGLSKVMEKRKTTPTLLVNSAGILGQASFLSEDLAHHTNVMDINVKGTFIVCQAVANAMTRHSLSGSFVNIASVAGKIGYPGYVSYCASKGALVSFTKSIAKELASKGVRVNCVLPGLISTPMLAAMNSAELEPVIKTLTPLERVGKPEEVAEVIAFLLSDRSSYMLGTCVEVTGGAFM